MSDRKLPPRPVRVLAIAAVAALTVMGLITTAATPALAARNPVLLVALEAPIRNMLLARDVPLALLVLIATLRRTAAATLYFFLGRWYGDDAVRWLEARLGKGGAIVRNVERAFGTASRPMVFFAPVPLISVLAGATGMRLPVFVLVAALGSATVTVLVRLAGRALTGPVDAVLGFFEKNLVLATVVVASLVVISVLVQQLRGKKPVETLREVEKDLHDRPGERSGDEKPGA